MPFKQTTMTRVTQLEEFLREDPTDPFNYYALALEYLKQDVPRARQLFEHLSKAFPAYLPTYYPYTQLLIEENAEERAEEIFQQGIAMAQAHADAKTLRELRAAYNDWLFERG